MVNDKAPEESRKKKFEVKMRSDGSGGIEKAIETGWI